VTNCEKNEIGIVQVHLNASGVHEETAFCAPLVCVYTNERPWMLVHLPTKWTIKLRARVRPWKEVHNVDYWFDPEIQKVMNTGINSKDERDATLKKYLDDQVCKETYFDRLEIDL
jgi:hypothetical protein